MLKKASGVALILAFTTLFLSLPYATGYEWTISPDWTMQEPTYTGYTEVEKSDYTTIILFVISLILCIIGLALTVPLLPLISLIISVLNIIFISEPSIFNILLIVLNVTFTLLALVRAKTKDN